MKKVELITEAPRRRRFSSEFKAEVLSEITKTGTTIAEVSRRYGLSQSLIHQWRRNFEPESPFTKIMAKDPFTDSFEQTVKSLPVRITSPYGVVLEVASAISIDQIVYLVQKIGATR